MNPLNPNLMQKNPLLDKLHDIEGIDFVEAWPLAIGWLILGAFVLFILLCLMYWAIKKVIYLFSWKRESIKRLSDLERNLSDETAQNSVVTLSEYLRRIVLQSYARSECAGLSGEAWLSWLSKHDEKKFDWMQKGTLLIEAPYAPKDKHPPAHQVKELIHAVKNWVK